MKAIGYALIERYPDHLDTNKLVMVTVANEAFQELLMNWLAFTRARDVPVLVGALAARRPGYGIALKRTRE